MVIDSWSALGPKCCPRAHNFILIGGATFLREFWLLIDVVIIGSLGLLLVFFGNFWLFLMMVWSNPKMAAKHQLSCFPNVDYLNLELTTKKRIEKDSSKAENGMLFQNLLFGFPPFLVFGGQFWYVEVKKWPTICFNLMLGFFLDFLEPFFCQKWWGFLAIFSLHHHISKQLGLLSLLLLKSSGCLR